MNERAEERRGSVLVARISTTLNRRDIASPIRS
jgi:hypothetical protein